MDTATSNGVLPRPAAKPARPELSPLLDQLLSCSKEEQRYLLEQLLRDHLGETPPRETGIYNADGTAYVYILEPEHRYRLFVTPERLALWAAEDLSKSRPLSEINALLARGDENEIKAYLASLNADSDGQ